jgi:hypothetical protein
MISRLHRRSSLALPTLLVFLAGCGVGQYGSTGVNGAFSIAASSSTTNSNGEIQFSAQLPAENAGKVTWSVAGGDNASSLGEGHISASGLYTPPAALSQDVVRVQVMARLEDDPARTASANVSIMPGFVQSLLPENAALTANATLEAMAEIAEVSAGSVHWVLTGEDATGDLGTLSGASCQRSLDQYTMCKVTYTAPSSSLQGTVYLKAAVANSASGGSAGISEYGSATSTPLKILLNASVVNSSPVANQTAQTGAIALGSSGGNDNDYDTYQDADGESYVADCCGGTLGALVEDAKKNQYILSNNHVLAESDQGKAGDTIDEPGMIDDGCIPLTHAGSTLRPVGTLKYFVPLASVQSNVDAALASVVPGAVDPAGSILQLADTGRSMGPGEVLGPAPPFGGEGEVLTASNLNGLKLAKSGRTTGLTCSTVAAVDLSVKIDYFKDCAESQPYFTKTFTGQIGIAGDRFSDSGDSGALVVDASNAEPVGLFFAGGTDGNGHGLSVANPIGEVLRSLGAQADSTMSIVGTETPHSVACVRYDGRPAAEGGLVPAAARKRAEFVAETAGASLVTPESGVLSVSSGKSLDSPGEAAVVLYVDKTKAYVSVPETLNGVRTEVIATDASALARNTEPSTPEVSDGVALSANILTGAEAVVKQYAPRLLQDPAIFGVGVSQSLDYPKDPALLVLVDPDAIPRSMPATIGGLRVRYMKMHRFHVTRSKDAGLNTARSCALKRIADTATSGHRLTP